MNCRVGRTRGNARRRCARQRETTPQARQPQPGAHAAELPEKQQRHEYLDWESHERGFHQAVRLGDWKAIRLGTTKPIALYDLKPDLGETKNVASLHPHVVRKVERILKSARTDNDHWKINEEGIPGASPFAEDKK